MGHNVNDKKCHVTLKIIKKYSNSPVYRFGVFSLLPFRHIVAVFSVRCFFESTFCPCRRFLQSTLFPINVFYFSTICPSRRFLHSTFFLQSTFFTFRQFVLVDIFYLRSFVPVGVFSIDVLSHSAFFMFSQRLQRRFKV
jgi:hypothetical protein